MIGSRTGSLFLMLAVALGSPSNGLTQDDVRDGEPDFPAEAGILVEGAFQRCEGIAFSGEGDLYVAGNAALWRVETTGEVTKIAGMYSNLGLAPIGERDILMADFGPTNRFNLGPNADGIVWRVTPEGDTTRVVNGGIGDPNFVMVLADGSFLVTDDATDEILWVGEDGQPQLFTDAVGHPNGIALSSDGSTLYVAANGFGQIWRVDPVSAETVLVAEDMPGAASIAFGQGAFDHEAIYVTSTRTGRVWEVAVGARGAALHR